MQRSADRETTPSAIRRPRICLVGAALMLLAPAALGAAPAVAAPGNDNYLASTVIRNADGAFPTSWTGTADTTDATTQPDLFQPDKDGQPLGGGPAEPTACAATSVGKTVWYDFAPPLAGGVEVTAQGFDTSVAVYEYDERSSRITRQIACAATPGAGETLTLPEEVRPGKHYTVQVGGAVGADGEAASGALVFGFSYFGDRDGDGVLDALPDRCPDLPGVDAFAGCPPTLRPTVTYSAQSAGSGLKLLALRVGKAPAGATVKVSGGRRSSTIRVQRSGQTVSVKSLVGRTLSAGSSLQVRVTRGNGAGVYKHGAIGAAYTYPVRGGKFGQRTERCLLPGSLAPRKSCRKPTK